ncbi:MAG: hypothetical protein HQM01_14720 [Magnetococcales bacterium]|nr:hypothetical protein [Magnetococcales bacterium]
MRYITVIFVSAGLAVLVIAYSFVITLGAPIEAGRWVNECLVIKRTAIQRINPKMVILSGSNGLFGFSAQRFTELFGIPTVNASCNGGLGVDYINHYWRRFLAPGRVFVLPLEYQLYGNRRLANDALIYQMAGYDSDFFWNLSFTDKLTVLGSITPFTRIRLIRNFLWPYPKIESSGYQSCTLNVYGDETSNKIESRTESMLDRVKRRPRSVFMHDQQAWNVIADFVKHAKLASSRVVLSYPNIYSGALDVKRNSGFLHEIRLRAEDIGLQVVGDWSDAVFEDEDVFDSVDHQNNHGQIRSTDRLFAQLRNAGVL